MKFSSIDDHSWRDIPERPGLYFYHLNSITACKLGLYSNTEATDDGLLVARSAMISKLQLKLKFFRSAELTGILQEQDRSVNIRKSYRLKAVERHDESTLKKLELLPLALVPQAVDILEKTSFMNKPIYIGMTSKQTLKDRYLQHRQDFNDQKIGTFGGRLRQSGLKWTDLLYSSFEVDIRLAENSQVISELESFMQSLCDPILSKR